MCWLTAYQNSNFTFDWPLHVLGYVTPVVLGVDAPVHLQVIARGHLQPAHAPRVPSEVCHVIEAALVRHHYPPPGTHLSQLHQTENLGLILEQKITNKTLEKHVSPFPPLCWLWQPLKRLKKTLLFKLNSHLYLRKLRPHREGGGGFSLAGGGCWIFLGDFCLDKLWNMLQMTWSRVSK